MTMREIQRGDLAQFESEVVVVQLSQHVVSDR